MPDLADNETAEMKGSGAKPYILKNVGGVYSCTCPAWRNQSTGIERRTCKHLRKLRGDEAEEARLGGVLAAPVKVKTTEDGEAVASPPVLLAERWDNTTNLAGWWISEKLDGVRAYWDGKQFLSRNGNLYHAPDWFVEGLPDTPLDGELWLDRKAFNQTISIVRRQDKSDHWKQVKFVLFDAPSAGGGFEDRLGSLKELLGKHRLPFASLLDFTLCQGTDHLRSELARIEALGGEGLMLREPGSNYVAGRSSSLLKVKTFYDSEAVVVGHEPGKGKHKGRLGAVLVRLTDGTTFAVGTGFTDAQRSAPPPIGTTITFRFQELTPAGVPRFPSYVGLRRVDVPKLIVPSTPVEPVVPEKPAAVVSLPAQSAEAKRYFEFEDDKSSKFWEVWQAGSDMTTRWGKIGAAGQSKTKTYPTTEAAAKEVAKLIEKKLAEGYVEKE